MADFMISMRKKKAKTTALLNEMGATLFLTVPHDQDVSSDHSCTRKEWQTALSEALDNTGSVVCLIHSEQADAQAALSTQRQFAKQLKAQGHEGLVVGIDWVAPSGSLNVWDDRDAAREAAKKIRDDCIVMLCARQKDCSIDVHVLAHGSGAFVLREAMTLADEKQSFKNSFWSVSQVALVGADISSRSLRSDNPKSASLYRHCHGLSNYQNPYDEQLSLVSERAGRTGLPHNNRHRKSININCEEQFTVLDKQDRLDNPLKSSNFSHDWYLFNNVLLEDFVHCIHGNIDRHYIPTRRMHNGEVCLYNPESIILLEE